MHPSDHRTTPGAPPRLDATDLRVIDRLHGGLPLSDRPFAEVAAELGLAEDALINHGL